MTRRWLVLLVGGAALTALLTLLAVFVDSDVTRVAVPGIVTGVGTAALAVATFMVIAGDSADRRRRDAQDADAAVTARQAQAGEVVQWLEDRSFNDSTVVRSGFQTGRPPLSSASYHCVVVRNGSRLPVWDVTLTWDGHPGASNRRIIRVVPPESERSYPFPGDIGQNTPVFIQFRDASGRYWFRDAGGWLMEMDGPPADLDQIPESPNDNPQGFL